MPERIGWGFVYPSFLSMAVTCKVHKTYHYFPAVCSEALVSVLKHGRGPPECLEVELSLDLFL